MALSFESFFEFFFVAAAAAAADAGGISGAGCAAPAAPEDQSRARDPLLPSTVSSYMTSPGFTTRSGTDSGSTFGGSGSPAPPHAASSARMRSMRSVALYLYRTGPWRSIVAGAGTEVSPPPPGPGPPGGTRSDVAGGATASSYRPRARLLKPSKNSDDDAPAPGIEPPAPPPPPKLSPRPRPMENPRPAAGLEGSFFPPPPSLPLHRGPFSALCIPGPSVGDVPGDVLAPPPPPP